MISKLRKKIIAINVVSVCIVFFVAEVLMFAIGFNRLDDERKTRISAALDFDYVHDDFDDNNMFSDIALIVYDAFESRILYCGIGSDRVIAPDALEECVAKVVASKSDNGWLSPWSVKYYKRAEGKLTKIVISNSSLHGRNNTPYLLISGGTLLVGVASYFAISWILARIALAPVEESWSKQRQFVADASHELKTPLSVIMANTEIIASHQEETVASQMKWIENTRAESKRMAELVADLLFLAKHDDGHQVRYEAVNMSDCIEKSALGYDAVFYENGKEFRYEICPDVFVHGNSGQLKQLVTILLDNANKYSVGKGNILLQFTSNAKRIILTVSNDSDELTEENLTHLFDRFYTVDKSRNTDKGGNGLGLSIAKTICQSHGGDLTVGYHDGRTTFTAELPVCKQKKNNQ